MKESTLQSLIAMTARLLDNCGYADVLAILEMEENFPDSIEAALDIENITPSFGLFVEVTENMAIDKIRDNITEEQAEVLFDIQIDDNFVAWGAVYSYGDSNILSKDAQRAFAEWVRHGDAEYKENFLKLANKEQRGVAKE